MATAPITCPECGGAIKHIPAGVSKTTGKPYGEFWACGERCGFTWQKPKPQASQATYYQTAPQSTYQRTYQPAPQLQATQATPQSLTQLELKEINATLKRIEKIVDRIHRGFPYREDTSSDISNIPAEIDIKMKESDYDPF